VRRNDEWAARLAEARPQLKELVGDPGRPIEPQGAVVVANADAELPMDVHGRTLSLIPLSVRVRGSALRGRAVLAIIDSQGLARLYRL
jgi:hypothetical protein